MNYHRNDNKLKIKVGKVELLNTIRENRSKHEAAYKEAKVGFAKALESELEAKLNAVRSGEKIDLHIDTPRVFHYLEHYDDVINMLEFASDTEIEIDHEQFKHWVKDDWEWSGGFREMASTYQVSAPRR